MFKSILIAILFCYTFSSYCTEVKIFRVSVLASGKLLLNGEKSDLNSLNSAFSLVDENKYKVWYYRENGRSEPPPEAIEVMKLILKHKLPISMSTKPDFSDYVYEDRKLQQRK